VDRYRTQAVVRPAAMGGGMWWKLLLAYLIALGGLLWFVYRLGNSLNPADPSPSEPSSP
jgi:hypothetical protein